ncbi:hypothetical protein VIGAN_01331500 [Vigna angularis var. angularis]|uniref:Uncharacterized protein n=1 Tax=Vigna angularis var. angularis TaxID=157739 RepID=A0A0S3R4F4_PHAAN|nr:hypothetical protein VIGAN_01331500 [Vigna angularis var. angularis]
MYYLVPGIMMGMDNMASETALQSSSICRSNESSVMLISISHIASNVNFICKQFIGVRTRSTYSLLETSQRYHITPSKLCW